MRRSNSRRVFDDAAVEGIMTESCVYCGCDVNRHDPVYVDEGLSGERTEIDAFCNYGCLWAYINEENLVLGTGCRFDPE